MAIYIVTGKLGSGKTLACVGRVRDALNAGKRVATNLDLNMRWPNMVREKQGRKWVTVQRGWQTFVPRHKAVHCVRIPDKPTLADLEAIGCGNDERDESRNGLIVLDELGAWLNTRSWGDKDRQPVIEWLLHSRKLGWDVYFIIQHQNMVDKQVREGLAEFLVSCRRTDRLRIPLLTSLFKGWGVNLRPPQVHVATVRYGTDPQALVSDRWWYRGRELYQAYDTRQVFTNARTGPYSLLSPRLLLRTEPEGVSMWDRHRALVGGSAQRAPRQVPKPKLPHVAASMKIPPDLRTRVLQRVESGARFGGALAGAAD